MEPFLAQIIMFGGNFAPRGWAFCDGQLLSINQYPAVFSLMGTTYGGDGRTTFALPDLRGRLPMHPGNGPGLTARRLGQEGGSENVTLTTDQVPNHTHTISAANQGGDDTDPTTGGAFGSASDDLYIENTQSTSMKNGIMSSVGGGQSHSNMQPYACVNFIIALEGIFPSRS